MIAHFQNCVSNKENRKKKTRILRIFTLSKSTHRNTLCVETLDFVGRYEAKVLYRPFL